MKIYQYIMSFVSLAGKAVPLMVALASCQKDLVYPDTTPKNTLTVRFDWAAAPEADPEEMSLMVYTGTAQPVRFQFTDKAGGEVLLTEGDYQFLAYSSDNEYYTRGNTWSGFEVYSNETDLNAFSRMFASTRSVPRTRGTENQLVIYEPEELWTGAYQHFSLDIHTVRETVTIPMKDVTYDYNFIIRNVDHLDYVVEIAATLTGMSESVYPSTGKPSDTACIIPFPMEKVDETTVRGSVRTLGHCPGYADDVYNDHFLVVYVEMKSGGKYYYSIDVTEQMHDIDHLTGGLTYKPIIIDGLPLPKPITNGSGFQPDITVWNEVNIGIDL